MNLFKKGGPLSDLVEKATSPTAEDLNWTSVFEGADYINLNAEGGQQAVKAIKRRLKKKNPLIQRHAISLTDAWMKNCGARFWLALAHPDSVSTLMALFSNADFVEENRLYLVTCICEWSGSITDPSVQPALIGLLAWLNDRGYGTQTAPVIGVRQGSRGDNSVVRSGQYLESFNSHTWQPTLTTFEDRKAKIEADLVSAGTHIGMFVEALNFAKPEEDITRNELVQEFRSNCKEIRSRMIRLIQEIDDEELLGKLVKVKQEIDDAMTLYEDILDGGALRRAMDESKEVYQARQQVTGGIVFREQRNDDLMQFSDDPGPFSHDPFSDQYQASSGAGPSAKKLGKMPAIE